MGNEKIVETRIKDGPKEKSSSETKVKKMAEEIESKSSVASPLQTVKTLATTESSQSAGI